MAHQQGKFRARRAIATLDLPYNNHLRERINQEESKRSIMMKPGFAFLFIVAFGCHSVFGQTPAAKSSGGNPSFAISSKVSIAVPDKAIEKSFQIAEDLVVAIRKAAYKHYNGHDGWLSVSLGKNGPQESYDPRDFRYGPKCAAYLWGDDPTFIPEMGKRLFFEQHDQDGKLMWDAAGQCSIHIAQVAKHFSDYFRYAERDEFVRANWPRLLTILKWTLAHYDRDDDGLIEHGQQLPDYLWAYLVGEPTNSFMLKQTQNDVVVVSSMEVCEWVQIMAAYGEANHLPETDWLKTKAAQMQKAIETLAYDSDAGYYYLLRRTVENKWYHSGGGINEDSRELDVTPYYAAFVGGNNSRGRKVAEYAQHVLMDCNVFPMPLYYPRYYWVCPNYGPRSAISGGCWEESYYNCVRSFAKYGMFEAAFTAIKRRSDAYVRDNRCDEWYLIDGKNPGARDQYGISGTAHVSAVIEGLFGITPAQFGFNEVNIWPAMPASWANQPATISVALPNGGYLKYTYMNDKSAKTVLLTIETNRQRMGHFRVPVYGPASKSITWNGAPMDCDIANQEDSEPQKDIVIFDKPFEKAILKIAY